MASASHSARRLLDRPPVRAMTAEYRTRAHSSASLPPLPLRLERLQFGRGHVAVFGPAAGEREPAEAAGDLAEETEAEDRERRRGRVKFRSAREETPHLQPRANRRRREVPLELALAPVAHQVRQRNAH